MWKEVDLTQFKVDPNIPEFFRQEIRKYMKNHNFVLSVSWQRFEKKPFAYDSETLFWGQLSRLVELT